MQLTVVAAADANVRRVSVIVMRRTLYMIISIVMFVQCEAYISEDRLSEGPESDIASETEFDSREYEYRNKIYIYTPAEVEGIYYQPFLYPSGSSEKWYLFDEPGDYPSRKLYHFQKPEYRKKYHVIVEGMVSQMGDGNPWGADRLFKLKRFKEKTILEQDENASGQ